MTLPYRHSLLRRTAVAFAATAALFIAAPASALTVTLSTGQTCTYSGMTVDPSGNLTVTCSGGSTTTTPPPTTSGPDTFSMSAPSPVGTGSNFNVTISRTGGSTSNVGINWAVNGSCTLGAGAPASQIVFTPTMMSATIPVVAASTSGGCSAFFNLGWGPSTVMTGTTAVDITVSSSATTTPTTTTTTTTTTPPPPTVTGCPTPAVGTIVGNLPTSPGTHLFNDVSGSYVMASGVISALQLPALPSGIAEAWTQLSYSAVTPGDPAQFEISISKCPGVIDPTGSLTGAGAACYFSTTNAFSPSLPWFGKESVYYGTKAQIIAGGNCWAGQSEGTWYANVRYTYSSCTGGSTGKCGEMIQWQSLSP